MLPKTSERIALHRTEQEVRSDVITTFRYRQALALTLFEARCKKASAEERRFIVADFENNADEMEHHGFYGHYHDRLLQTLTHTSDTIKGLHRHISVKPEQAEAVMMAYQLSTPAERDCFKRHLIAGVVETRPKIRAFKPKNDTWEKMPMPVLGNRIIGEYQFLLTKSSDLNVFSHLSHQPLSDRKMIHTLVQSAIQLEKEQGLTTATKQLTDDLLPYYFKEAKPFIPSAQKTNSAIANYAAFYARREKFFHVRTMVSSFAWLFLTLNSMDQRHALEHLYPECQRKINRHLKKFTADYCCCHD